MHIRNILLILIISVFFVGCGNSTQVNKRVTNESSINDLLAPAQAEDFYNDSNKLVVEKGKATVTRSDGEIEVVKSETTASVGDSIEVSDKGEATLYWFDDSISRLSAGSTITISKADYNPEQITETHIDFQVVVGDIWSKVTNLVNEDSEFLSSSGNVVAGVRGTTYNFSVKDGDVNVEAVDHAAFVNLVNKKTGKVLSSNTVTKGNRASIKKEKSTSGVKRDKDGFRFAIEVEEMPQERWNEPWFKYNQKDDAKAAKAIAKKNIERMQARVGALPGDKDYEEKHRLIEEKLSEIDDEQILAEMEARFAQMKANEVLLLLQQAKQTVNPQDIADHLEDARNLILDSDLSEDQKGQILNRMQGEIMIFDRAMEYVLPDEQDLYKAKGFLREHIIELEEDPQMREDMQEMMFERRLYEMEDYVEEHGFDANELKNVWEAHSEDFEQLKDRFKENEEFLPVFNQFVEQFDEFDIDPALIRKHREYIEAEMMNSEGFIPPEDFFISEEDLLYNGAPEVVGEARFEDFLMRVEDSPLFKNVEDIETFLRDNDVNPENFIPQKELIKIEEEPIPLEFVDGFETFVPPPIIVGEPIQ